MGIKGYLTEKSVLEIFAERPSRNSPPRTAAAACRALAQKYNISTKSIQQVWNRKSWTEVTDRIPSPPADEYGGSAGGGRSSGHPSQPSPSSDSQPASHRSGGAGGSETRRREGQDEEERARTKRNRGAEGVSADSPSSGLEAGRGSGRAVMDAAFSFPLVTPSLPTSFFLPPSFLPFSPSPQAPSLPPSLPLSHLPHLHQFSAPSLLHPIPHPAAAGPHRSSLAGANLSGNAAVSHNASAIPLSHVASLRPNPAAASSFARSPAPSLLPTVESGDRKSVV